jgi:hypothetical protein
MRSTTFSPFGRAFAAMGLPLRFLIDQFGQCRFVMILEFSGSNVDVF